MMRKLSLFFASVMIASSLLCGQVGMATVNAAGSNFVDVAPNAYYYNAVNWAVEKGVTTGKGNNRFDPTGDCKRSEAVTFLWRAAGSPEPKSLSNFTDVPANAFYTKAVAWAVEKGITTGVGDGKFNPDGLCKREQIVTFLWRASGSPSVSGTNRFSDVPANAYYAKAVAWAVENGITTGTSTNKFSPTANCQRGQIVTFLYRANGGTTSNMPDGDYPSSISVLKEYTLKQYGSSMHIYIIKNNSSQTLDIDTNSVAYNVSGNVVGASNGSIDALPSGCTGAFYEYFDTSENISRYSTNYEVSVSNYNPIQQNLSVNITKIDGGAVTTITNAGNESAEFVEAMALFFKDGILVDEDWTYFTDSDSEIKPGKNVSKQFNCYYDNYDNSNFDSVEVYIMGGRGKYNY